MTVLFLSLVFQLEMKPQGRLLMEAKYYLERSGESLALLASHQLQIVGSPGRLASANVTANENPKC